MQACKFVGLMILLGAAMVSPAADGGWLKHVPEADRSRVNPFAGQPEAIACSVPPTEKSSGYCETATCQRVSHLGGVARADALADYRLH